MVVGRGWGRGTWEFLFNGYRGSVWENEKSSGNGWSRWST